MSDDYGEIPGLSDMPDRRRSITLYDKHNRAYVAQWWEGITTTGWAVAEANRRGDPILYTGRNCSGTRWLAGVHGEYNPEPPMTEERRRLLSLYPKGLRDVVNPPKERGCR